jgi:hypothetical protein
MLMPTYNEAIHCGQRSLNAQTRTGSAAAYLAGRLREAQQAVAQRLSPALRLLEVMKRLGCQPPNRHGHDGKHLLSAGCLAQDGMKATTVQNKTRFALAIFHLSGADFDAASAASLTRR